MDNIYMMLCCGAGMSSGFLAKNARKAAKKRGMVATVEARSESEAAQFYSTIDIMLLGPHYDAMRDEMAEQAKQYNVPVVVIPQDIYGALDGEALLDFAVKSIEEYKA